MLEFCPMALAEDPTPDYLLNCQECGLHEQGIRMVWGEGNADAPIMIILDNPRAHEDPKGESIVCRTRQTS